MLVGGLTHSLAVRSRRRGKRRREETQRELPECASAAACRGGLSLDSAGPTPRRAEGNLSGASYFMNL